MKSKVELAQELAKKIHSEHPRLSGESYYQHVQKTAKYLTDIGMEDETLIVLTFLHHAFDLSTEFKDQIKKTFGIEIVDLIEKYNQLRNNELKQIPAKDLNQKFSVPTFLNLTHDTKLIILRLADKTSNITTTYALADEPRKKAAERALYLYNPVCQLLGLMTFAHTLQDEAFKILNPAEYLRIEEYIKKSLPKLNKTLTEIEKFLLETLAENDINAKIEWRIKGKYSIYKKVNLYNFGVESLYDIAGLRILVNTVEECYKTEDLLKQLWETVPNRRKDSILIPRASGYQSLHNSFYIQKKMPLEIQIKTFDMHENNEFGNANHLLYKMSDAFVKYLKDNPDLLKDIHYQNATDLSLQAFDKKVYVFTPKGDIVELPKGACLIDFAYALHADLGHSCVGGIVNGQIHKLDYQVKNGDRIEIKTVSSKKKPSEDWLKMVITHKAKVAIKKALKLE